MTSDKGILIQNIYYMLTYAFQVLKQENYREVAAEEFERIQDLFAAILAKGISQQLKQGLYREYVSRQETLPVLRGKLNINETIQNRIQQRKVLTCEFDELSEDNRFNQILKTTAELLMREKTVAAAQKQALKRVLPFFDGVQTVNPLSIRWNTLRFQRMNRSYEMLLNVCRLVLEGMLQTTEDGRYKMTAFSDEHMERLYERFILEYYRQHHPQLKASASQVPWALDENADSASVSFLPTMQTDIMLRCGDRTLIIDAKYYGHTMQTHYDRHRVHSANLYQIFTYVKNQEAAQTGSVSGMLLYAKTEETIVPDFTLGITGNQISVKTLNLNKPFAMIARQLDEIARHSFRTMSLWNHAT